MISNELLEYCESLVSYQGPAPTSENPHLREYINGFREVWEARVMRDLRNRAGMTTCSGGVDCLDHPTSLCMRGDHPTCSAHTDSCYLCKPQSSWRRQA
jgi:hypothetical protein